MRLVNGERERGKEILVLAINQGRTVRQSGIDNRMDRRDL